MIKEIAKNNVRCQNPEKWQAYHEGSLDEAEQLAMEMHLLDCESCLQSYLSIVENQVANVQEPRGRLASEFTDRLMGEVFGNKEASYPRNIWKSKANILISYCAAASIAMFFWIGGYFETLSGSFDKGIQYMKVSQELAAQKETEKESLGIIQTGWTHRDLKQDDSSFLKNIISNKGVD